MRKPASYGLTVLCASLLFGLSGSFAQRLPNRNGRDSAPTQLTMSVDAVDSCNLDNQVKVEAAVPLFNSPQPFSAADTCVPASQCCKICSKGKACGNTCIRRDYTCHVGRGCACNSDEVCTS